MIDNRTPERNYTLPDGDNKLAEDVLRLIAAVESIDSDMAAVMATVLLKSDIGHQHTIAQVIGLVSALAGKTDVTHHDNLGDLNDVDVSGVSSGMTLIRQASLWIPVLLQINHIAGLEAALNSKATPADITALETKLLGGVGSAFDTLIELAAALGNDPNFATTITTLVGTKAAKSANLSDLANVITARQNLKIVTLTEAAYAALGTKDPDTLYFTTA